MIAQAQKLTIPKIRVVPQTSKLDWSLLSLPGPGVLLHLFRDMRTTRRS
jgi:hypothetical protein